MKNLPPRRKFAACAILLVFSLLLCLFPNPPVLQSASAQQNTTYITAQAKAQSKAAAKKHPKVKAGKGKPKTSKKTTKKTMKKPVPKKTAVLTKVSKSVTSAKKIKTSSGTTSSSGTATSSSTTTSSGTTTSSSPTTSSSSSTSSQTTSSSPTTSSSTQSGSAPTFIRPANYLVGYYGGWAAYSGFTPDKINASGLNVINYAFASIGADLKITVSDSSIDYSNFSKLAALKSRYPGLKTVISIGGWDGSGRFSDAALTDSSRAVFAASVVSFIKTYSFDGVDIDWEYPTGGGLSTNVTRSCDRQDFGLLLTALRQALDAQGIKDNKHYILSFAWAANSSFASGVGLSGIAKTVDYAFLMTYDMHGGWDKYSDFNAPLYIPSGTSPQYKVSVDGAVNIYLANGFPANKLIMGVPFYGYAYKVTSSANGGLWQPFTSCTSVGFDTIVSKYLSDSSFIKSFNTSAQVPTLFNGSTFICYDDQNSIAIKTRYAVSKGLFGVGAWDLSYDRSAKLIGTIKGVLG